MMIKQHFAPFMASIGAVSILLATPAAHADIKLVGAPDASRQNQSSAGIDKFKSS